MVHPTCPEPAASSLRQRVMQLTVRWLPALLLRVGVSKLEADKLREVGELSELEIDLSHALQAVQLRGCARGESAAQVMDAIETIAKLRRALELDRTDPTRAMALVDEVDRRWLRLVLFGLDRRRGEVARDETGPQRSVLSWTERAALGF